MQASKRGNPMVLCDACDAGWHLRCMAPPLAAVPEGDWFCPACLHEQARACGGASWRS